MNQEQYQAQSSLSKEVCGEAYDSSEEVLGREEIRNKYML